MMDTGANTVAKTFGWEAPEGADPFHHWVEGVAVMGDTPFAMPIITEVEAATEKRGALFQGGYVPGLALGSRFDSILSLYPWGAYPTDEHVVLRAVTLYDSHDVTPETVRELAEWVVVRRQSGSVLVHCQAGLNRSGLIVGASLVLLGSTPDEAIALMRAKRSPAVLCNPTFEAFLREDFR